MVLTELFLERLGLLNGKVGGAYSFDGNDFIRVEESSNRYDGGGSWSEMSLECWVKASAVYLMNG